jgi:tetratricopeptide (TPR) repeat protein
MSEKRTTSEYMGYLAVVVSMALVIFGKDIFKNSWGLSALHQLPSPALYVWTALAVAGLALIVFKKTIWPFTLMEKHFWQPQYTKARWVWLAGIIIIFGLFRLQGHFWGMGYNNLANFAQKEVTLFRWYEYGGTLLPWWIYKFLDLTGISKLTAAEWGYRLISFISGAVYIIYACKLARLFTDDDRMRTGFLLLLLFGGQLIYFMGMPENYIMLPALLLVQTVLAAQRHISGTTNGLLKLWLVTALGVFVHFIFICTLPAVLYASFSPGRPEASRPGKAGLIIGLGAIVVGLVWIYWRASTDIFVESRLLHIAVNPATPYYSLIGMKNLSEKLNALFFMVPLFPLYGLAALTSFRRASQNRQTSYLMLLTMAMLLTAFIINPPNGMARELALFGFLFLGLILWGGYVLVASESFAKMGLAGRLPYMALLLIIPVIWLYQVPESGIKFLKGYLGHNEFKYESALVAFRDYYYKQGRFGDADREEQSIRGSAPGRLESDLISDLFYHKRYADALEFADRLVERFPYQGNYRIQRGNILKHFKRYEEAESEFKLAIRLNSEDLTAYHFLSELYRENKLEHKCLEVLNRARSISPTDSVIMVDFIGFHYRMRDYEKADSLSDIMLDKHPGDPYGYMYKGLLLERNKQPQRAADNYLKFIGLDKDLPEVPIIRQRLERIAPERLDSLDTALKEQYFKIKSVEPTE